MDADGYVFDTEAENVDYHSYGDLTDILGYYVEHYGDQMNVRSIGTTEEGRNIPSIELHTKGKPVKGHIIIAGGHHGTEPAGTESSLELMDKLLTSETEKGKYLLENYQIDIIPAMNADMYARPFHPKLTDPMSAKHYPEYRQYDNATGDATNHYYKGQMRDPFFGYVVNDDPAKETYAVADYVKEIAKDNDILLTLDLHETPGMDGFLVIRENQKEKLGGRIVQRMHQKGYPLLSAFERTEQGVLHDGLLEAGEPYSDTYHMVFSGYCARHDAKHNLTFETPSQIALKHRVNMNLIAAEQAIDDAVFKEMLQ